MINKQFFLLKGKGGPGKIKKPHGKFSKLHGHGGHGHGGGGGGGGGGGAAAAAASSAAAGGGGGNGGGGAAASAASAAAAGGGGGKGGKGGHGGHFKIKKVPIKKPKLHHIKAPKGNVLFHYFSLTFVDRHI